MIELGVVWRMLIGEVVRYMIELIAVRNCMKNCKVYD